MCSIEGERLSWKDKAVHVGNILVCGKIYSLVKSVLSYRRGVYPF